MGWIIGECSLCGGDVVKDMIATRNVASVAESITHCIKCGAKPKSQPMKTIEMELNESGKQLLLD